MICGFFGGNILWFFVKKFLVRQNNKPEILNQRPAECKVFSQIDLGLFFYIVRVGYLKITQKLFNSVCVIGCNNDFVALTDFFFHKGQNFFHFWGKTWYQRTFKLFGKVRNRVQKVVKKDFFTFCSRALKLIKSEMRLVFQWQGKRLFGIFFDLFWIIIINLSKLWKNLRRLIKNHGKIIRHKLEQALCFFIYVGLKILDTVKIFFVVDFLKSFFQHLL